MRRAQRSVLTTFEEWHRAWEHEYRDGKQVAVFCACGWTRQWKSIDGQQEWAEHSRHVEAARTEWARN